MCRSGIALADAEREDDQLWRLLAQWSLCLSFQGRFAEAAAILEQRGFSDHVSTATRARVLNQKGHVLSRVGNFTRARATLDEALRLANQADVPPLVGEIQVCRLTLFFYLAQYDEVGKCARSVLQIGERHNLPMMEASACAGIAKSPECAIDTGTSRRIPEVSPRSRIIPNFNSRASHLLSSSCTLSAKNTHT
ncbi:MAG: tetratricopeptide repeat protein [Candidatus Acidiferrum sp.]